MGKTNKVLIVCDFPGCTAEFDDVQEWSKHYMGHMGLQQIPFGELAAAGKDKLLSAIRYNPELVLKGLVIREIQPLIGMRRVDLIGTVTENTGNTYVLIDATVGTGHEPKIRKMRHCAKYLRKTARLFGAPLKSIRLFIVTERGAIEIPEHEEEKEKAKPDVPQEAAP